MAVDMTLPRGSAAAGMIELVKAPHLSELMRAGLKPV